MTPLERFSTKYQPEPNSGCWLWDGTMYLNGYGQFWMKPSKRLAHRASYELHVGPIPDGLDLDHLCRVRSCVNPDHLEPVTRSENLRRGEAGGRPGPRGAHCRNGHEFTEENTYRHARTGWRQCNTCRLEAKRRERARKRGGK